jgi:hypothetical protein
MTNATASTNTTRQLTGPSSKPEKPPCPWAPTTINAGHYETVEGKHTTFMITGNENVESMEQLWPG